MEITPEAKITISLLAAAAVIIVGGAWWAGRGGSEGATVPASQANRLVRDDSAVLGARDAAVTVVEFGDFQCPACGALYPVMKEVKELYRDKPVRFVFRHFPLSQHEHARLAAEASLAAGAQDKFWEYYDLLFTNQKALARPDLESYAVRLGLNMDQFKSALDERRYGEEVQRDVSDARALGVRATPTVFINGVQYRGGFSVEELKRAIEEELEP